jgi:hypothetical protein
MLRYMRRNPKYSAIYKTVVVARSTSFNRPNCEFRVILLCFAATARERAKTSPRTLATTDLAASPWQRTVSHFRPNPEVSGETQNGSHPPPTVLTWFDTLWLLPIAGIAGSNPADGMDICLFWVLRFFRGVCDGSIPRSGESYRTCVCHWVLSTAAFTPEWVGRTRSWLRNKWINKLLDVVWHTASLTEYCSHVSRQIALTQFRITPVRTGEAIFIAETQRRGIEVDTRDELSLTWRREGCKATSIVTRKRFQTGYRS